MGQTSTMTIRLPETIKNKLEDLAQATDRSKAYLAAKAIEEFVTTQEWQIQAIQEAVKEADSPQAKFIEHDVVVKKMKARMARRKGK
ncbi:MAG: CopG family transcriptional regulator [Acidobacteria bacterium]|nr:CopG family transcriptional regulator [Acidobacteriota bacterium]MBU4306458.1 CopG family transcriptional regulator [Acidobacteriota bacterium]MBU4404165.1 CopG family transcriptional regulator [Acidobacteriota bacterium]MCG2812457.1 CopG family transcriptional regulator [Candidatus Aminicenantes bacterium]